MTETTAVAPATKRMLWVDIMKGIGIIAVVVGHVSSTRFVYVFHMPLFFIISGFLMSATPKPTLEVLRRNAVRLLVPYFVFLAIFYVPELLHAMRKGHDAPGLELLYGGTELTGRLTVFWFVTVLFLSILIFNALLRLTGKGNSPLLFGAILVSAYVVSDYGVDLPWGAHVVPMALFFIWIGNRSAVLYPRLTAMTFTTGRRAACVAIGCAAVIAAWIWRDELAMDMKIGDYGMPIISVLLSIIITYAIAILSMWLSRVRHLGAFLALTGEASLLIMFLHMAIHRTMHTLPWPVTLVPSVLVPLLLYIVARRYPLTSLLFLGKKKR